MSATILAFAPPARPQNIFRLSYRTRLDALRDANFYNRQHATATNRAVVLEATDGRFFLRRIGAN